MRVVCFEYLSGRALSLPRKWVSEIDIYVELDSCRVYFLIFTFLIFVNIFNFLNILKFKFFEYF